MTDVANNPSVTTSGSVFAAVGPTIPDYRQIIRISQSADGGYTSEVVQDYTTRRAVEAALAELADDDDTPEQQALLMTAWQALAQYLACCDDEDKSGALQALKVVSNLMADGDSQWPLPDSTFGAGNTMQSAATEYTCPKCTRDFASEAGLINHLKSVHAAREKTPYKKGDPNQDRD